ncbi:hypothetical protein [Streptomyces sp. NPDC051364]|uniref:hypothetical protein n=1 Tax=Streptomyces sp. NPDC051364 TaxID=3155799 RepID=UPI00341FFB15
MGAGFDEAYVGQIGPANEGFFAQYRDKILPALTGCRAPQRGRGPSPLRDGSGS